MRVPDRSQPTPERPSAVHSVLEWLSRHVERLGPYASERGDQLVSGMLDELRAAERGGALEFAWTAHGLDRDDVGPVIVLLSPEGAALACARRRGAGRRPD